MNALEKTAVILLSFGEETATEVLKQLDGDTVSSLAMAMSKVRRFERDDSENVAAEFLTRMEDPSLGHASSLDYVSQVLKEALGERQAGRVTDSLAQGVALASTKSVIRNFNPSVLAESIRSERPQSIALVIAHLKPAAASELLSELPDDMAHEVLYRLAKLDSVHPQTLEELSAMLGEQLEDQAASQGLANIGGPKRTADLLHYLDTEMADSFLNELAQTDASVAESIREYMFTISDLIHLDSRSLQRVLREVPSDELARALRAAPANVVTAVLSNVSSRAAKGLREELDYGPRIKRSEAELAQKQLVRTALRLDIEGAITIAKGDDML